MATTPDPLSRHQQPASVQEYQTWFDEDGRLVKEAVMRQCLFEVGVDPSCQHDLWKFLFGIYPVNSSRRDQKTIDIENRANYVALKQRWEVLDLTIQIPEDEMVRIVPPYMEDSDDEDESSNLSLPFCVDHENRQTRVTVDFCSVCNNNGTPSASEFSRDSEPKCPQQSAAVYSHHTCTNSTNCDRRTCNLGESTDSAISEIQYSSCFPTSTSISECSGQDSLLQVSQSTSASHSHELCAHLNGRITSTSSIQSCDEPASNMRPNCRCRFRRKSGSSVLDKEGQALFNILEFPSKVYATRQPVDLERSYPKAKRVILKDVLRTDRNIHYFSHMRNLRKVHRILMIYAMFHPDVGYAQGMNDLLARFLVVTDSEVDSYWMFAKYMEYKREDFLEDTMMKKVALVKKLIYEIDHELYKFFETSECRDYLFCHRWLLLEFKREFPFEEGLRLFEVISSHYLELNSDKALVETDKVIAMEFEHDKGEIRAGRSMAHPEFTFDVFICVAILTVYSKEICRSADAASVYGTLNGLSMKMSLNEILAQAEYLFYKYCKLSITRGFSVVEL